MARLVLTPQQVDQIIQTTVRIMRDECRARGVSLSKFHREQLIPEVIRATCKELMENGVRFDFEPNIRH
jgi:hypothetical protein